MIRFRDAALGQWVGYGGEWWRKVRDDLAVSAEGEYLRPTAALRVQP